jgi:hypothetical protein
MPSDVVGKQFVAAWAVLLQQFAALASHSQVSVSGGSDPQPAAANAMHPKIGKIGSRIRQRRMVPGYA